MNVLVVGGGSMGRRRLRDLTFLLPRNVSLLEQNPDRCSEVAKQFDIKGFTDLEEALASKPNALVISTPPAYHERYVREALGRGIHVFCELPFVLGSEAFREICEIKKRSSAILGISGTIRYYPPYSVIRKMIIAGNIGKPLYLECSLGNHIADWHPYEDYRKFYASRAKEGGAGMDMILHELAPIQWWLGPITSVAARLSKVSSLEVDGPDNHDVLMTFASGCRGFFHHDIIEQGTIGRHIRITGQSGTIEWHQNQPAIRLYTAEDKQNHQIEFNQASDWQEAIEASRQMATILEAKQAASGKIAAANKANYSYESNYLREMQHFIEAAQGRHAYTLVTPEEESQTLNVFDAILRSSQSLKEVGVRV